MHVAATAPTTAPRPSYSALAGGGLACWVGGGWSATWPIGDHRRAPTAGLTIVSRICSHSFDVQPLPRRSSGPPLRDGVRRNTRLVSASMSCTLPLPERTTKPAPAFPSPRRFPLASPGVRRCVPVLEPAAAPGQARRTRHTERASQQPPSPGPKGGLAEAQPLTSSSHSLASASSGRSRTRPPPPEAVEETLCGRPAQRHA